MKLWGGRFEEGLDSAALRFSSSLAVDSRLIEEDIEGSIAHVTMLEQVGLVSSDEKTAIIDGLVTILSESRAKTWFPDASRFEDIHSAVESRLTDLIGSPAGKLHTGRSRNDQVITDVVLWLRKQLPQVLTLIWTLKEALVEQADRHAGTLMPGYTHLQRAQPVSLAFHLLAYVEMLHRDRLRWESVAGALTDCPLGAGALAGSTLPLDRDITAGLLGFARPTANALDTVSNRDFFLDAVHAAAMTMMHLSRLSEELILWSGSEWRFIRLSDRVTTGSSLMPQKKNPDMAELIRGKTGGLTAGYVQLQTLLKGLPLSYNRDLQEDKAVLFHAMDTVQDSLAIMSLMIGTMEVNQDRFAGELDGDFSLATDVADWLVLKGIPFREAHHVVGEVVRLCEKRSCRLSDLTLADWTSIHPVFTTEVLPVVRISTALSRKKTIGSPHPDRVKQTIRHWQKLLKREAKT